MRPVPLLLALLLSSAPAHATDAARQPVAIEAMTWPEIAAVMKAGTRTVIVPTGGTEQNGPFLATGKHNAIVSQTAEVVARQLGNALVAPVLAYVPEGRIDPPEGHMRFPGTISLRPESFAAVLEDTARSFRQEGFRLICFLGDHGGSQAVQQAVADRLNGEWQGTARVLQVGEYYAPAGQADYAAKHGIDAPDPQAHAGFYDTSETMAAAPALVRPGAIRRFDAREKAALGVTADATAASAAHGENLLRRKEAAAILAIRAAQKETGLVGESRSR